MFEAHSPRPALLIAACYLLGCSSGAANHTSNELTGDAGTTANVPIDQGTVDASVGSDLDNGRDATTDAGSAVNDTGSFNDAGSAVDDTGSFNDTGSAVSDGGSGSTSEPPGLAVDAGVDSADTADSQPATVPPDDCELDGGCTSQCTNQRATCAVVWRGAFCELEGFVGASTEVSCGQRAIVGTACCGECGCVPVEVFFDGTNCWQGMPTCAVPMIANTLFDPHPPGAVDGGWISAANNGVPGDFYLGVPDAADANSESGSEGGSEASNGAGLDANDSDCDAADAGTTSTNVDASTTDTGTVTEAPDATTDGAANLGTD